MRQSITIAYRHGSDDGEILSGPAGKVGEQKDALKVLGASETHPDFRRVEIWESDRGLTMFRKFKPAAKPVEAPTAKQVEERFKVKK